MGDPRPVRVVGLSPFSSIFTDKTRDGRPPGDTPDPARRQPGGHPGSAEAGQPAAPRFLGPAQRPGAAPGAVAAVREATETIDRYPEPAPLGWSSGWLNITGPHRPDHRRGRDDRPDQPDRPGLPRAAGPAGPRAGRPRDPPGPPFEPTYGEYRRTSAQNGLNTKVWGEHILGWIQDDEPEGATGLFWTGHPNNPTGRAWDRDRLLGFIDRHPALMSVVDEAYLPFLPDEADRTLDPRAGRRATTCSSCGR